MCEIYTHEYFYLHEYNFGSGSTHATDRFSMVFRSPANSTGLSVAESDGNNLLAYTDKNGQIIVALYLLNQQGSDAKVSVFDIAGYKVTEQSVVVGERTTLEGTFPESIYVLIREICGQFNF